MAIAVRLALDGIQWLSSFVGGPGSPPVRQFGWNELLFILLALRWTLLLSLVAFAGGDRRGHDDRPHEDLDRRAATLAATSMSASSRARLS